MVDVGAAEPVVLVEPEVLQAARAVATVAMASTAVAARRLAFVQRIPGAPNVDPWSDRGP